jgi:hypothetical protein
MQLDPAPADSTASAVVLGQAGTEQTTRKSESNEKRLNQVNALRQGQRGSHAVEWRGWGDAIAIGSVYGRTLGPEIENAPHERVRAAVKYGAAFS